MHDMRVASVQFEHQPGDKRANLAKVRLLAGDRRGALSAVKEGLAIDPTQKGLLEVFRRLGVRQPPVIAFLSRTNPLNHLLGRARHRIFQASRA